jgi:AmiR/NasT family two-component response regulator
MDIMAQTRCMIVEDQALIGMSLEASLEEAGFQVAGVFMSMPRPCNGWKAMHRTLQCSIS